MNEILIFSKGKLKLQQISSAKISFLGRQPDSNDELGSASAPKSSTLKRKFQDLYSPIQTIGQVYTQSKTSSSIITGFLWSCEEGEKFGRRSDLCGKDH